MGGDWPIVMHHSETASVDKTVMIIIDSFGTIPESFLTTIYKTVVGIDLRWVLRSKIGKSTADFVNAYNPDIVIIAYNAGQIGHPDPVVIAQFEFGMPVDEE